MKLHFTVRHNAQKSITIHYQTYYHVTTMIDYHNCNSAVIFTLN